MRPIFTYVLSCLACGVYAADDLADPFADPNNAISPATRTVEPLFRGYKDPVGAVYFPRGRESFYTGYLAAMKEPSLFKRDKERPDFELRFTWLRTFHDPLAIRIWRLHDTYMIRTIRLARQKDYSPGPATLDKTRKLTPTEWQTLKTLIDIPSMLKPMSEQEQLATTGGADGAMWIFETWAEEKYQMLEFWCPKDYGPKEHRAMGLDTSKMRDTTGIRRLSSSLFKISGITIPENEVY